MVMRKISLAGSLAVCTLNGMLDIDYMSEEKIKENFSACCYSSLDRFTEIQRNKLKELFGSQHLMGGAKTFLRFSETLFMAKDEPHYCIRRLVLQKIKRSNGKIWTAVYKYEKISPAEIIETVKDIYAHFPDGSYSSTNGSVIIYQKGIELKKLSEYTLH